MIAVDTSVAVAGFAPWHEHHGAALEALGNRPWLPAHCGVETYATLTRLPNPFRVPRDTAADYIVRRFGDRWLAPDLNGLRSLPSTLASAGVVGGASYDAVVAITALTHGALLRTLDRRAETVYRSVGVEYELVIT